MKTIVVLSVLATLLAIAQGYSGIAFMEDLRARPDGRIIQGWSAVNGQFPHQAFLLVSQSSGSRSACGASLISTTWVLTAAHCVRGFVSAQVHLGNVAYASSPVIVTSSNLNPHPNYNTANLNNDIALIGLTSAVSLTSNIQTVSLPSSTADAYAGRIAVVSGFGLTSNSGAVSPTLNFVNLTIITNTACQSFYGASVIITSTICGSGITSSAQGTCNGDSGGPMILQGVEPKVQIGVVSFGSSLGCSAAYPSGFVRPNHFLSWINQITGLVF